MTPGTTSESRAYDKLNRLFTDIAPAAWGTAAYAFDAIGNRTMNSTGSSTFNSTFDTHSGLLSSTTGPNVLEPNMTYTWSPAGRLSSSSDQSTYQYDAWGRRVQKLVGGANATVYHYDLSGRLIAETMSDGTLLSNFYYLGGTLAAVEGCIANAPPTCTERNWYHMDAFDNVLARTNSSGALVAQISYDPWGAVWLQSGLPGERQQRTAAIDSGTGLLRHGKRMYSRARGQFLEGVANRAPYPRGLLTPRSSSFHLKRLTVKGSALDVGQPDTYNNYNTSPSWWKPVIPTVGLHLGFFGVSWERPMFLDAPVTSGWARSDSFTYGEWAGASVTFTWGSPGPYSVTINSDAPVWPSSISLNGTGFLGQVTGFTISIGPGAGLPFNASTPQSESATQTAADTQTTMTFGTDTYTNGTATVTVPNDEPTTVTFTDGGPVVTFDNMDMSGGGVKMHPY